MEDLAAYAVGNVDCNNLKQSTKSVRWPSEKMFPVQKYKYFGFEFEVFVGMRNIVFILQKYQIKIVGIAFSGKCRQGILMLYTLR